MVELFFHALANPVVPWALSASLALLALCVWLEFRRRMGEVIQGLSTALAAVEQAEGQSAFRARFAGLWRDLADNPVVGEAWRAYAPTLAPAPGNEEAIGYGRRPAESFDERLMAAAGVNLRFYHAVPNLLVGGGLLFTFLGLVAALYFASRGIGASDVQQAQAALKELLAAATFKFVTSIAGLASSLVFSWREKALLYRAQRLIERFCAALEARMVPVTPESLGAAQLTEMRQHGQQLRQIGRNLLVRLPESLENAITAETLQALSPLREGAQQLADRLGQSDALLVGLMERRLAELVGRGEPGDRLDVLKELAVAVARLADRLQPAPSSVTTSDDPPDDHRPSRRAGWLGPRRAAKVRAELPAALATLGDAREGLLVAEQTIRELRDGPEMQGAMAALAAHGRPDPFLRLDDLLRRARGGLVQAVAGLRRMEGG